MHFLRCIHIFASGWPKVHSNLWIFKGVLPPAHVYILTFCLQKICCIHLLQKVFSVSARPPFTAKVHFNLLRVKGLYPFGWSKTHSHLCICALQLFAANGTFPSFEAHLWMTKCALPPLSVKGLVPPLDGHRCIPAFAKVRSHL